VRAEAVIDQVHVVIAVADRLQALVILRAPVHGEPCPRGLGAGSASGLARTGAARVVRRLGEHVARDQIIVLVVLDEEHPHRLK
jgi:hypothetical protein